jgi:environmental stress-induced protein Ves
MSLNTVRLDRVAAQPWKNGGGHTRELLAWPDAAHWQLRISVADIERDGPFSPYPGIERWITVVSGAGMVLAWPDRRHRQGRTSPPFRFDGGTPPHCELLDRASADLNLMVRRETGAGTLSIAEPDVEHVSRASWRGLFAADATRLQIDDTDVATLQPGVLLWSDHAARQRWRVQPPDASAARAWWIDYTPIEGPR